MTNEQILLQALNKVVGLDLTDLKQLDVQFDESNVDELLKVCDTYFFMQLDDALDMENNLQKDINNRVCPYPVDPNEICTKHNVLMADCCHHIGGCEVCELDDVMTHVAIEEFTAEQLIEHYGKQGAAALVNRTYPVIPSECMDENRVVDLEKTHLPIVGARLEGKSLVGDICKCGGETTSVCSNLCSVCKKYRY